MRTLIVLLAMLVCLFGPTVIFAWVGHRSLGSLSKRPSRGGEVMIPVLLKLVVTAVLLIGMLMVMLKMFSPKAASADESSSRKTVFTPDKLRWIERQALIEKIELNKGQRPDFHLVDLRIESEFASGSIEGAVNMPKAKLSFLAEKQMALGDEIVVFGYPGNDAVTVNAAIVLIGKGFTRVSVLKGGYFKPQ